MALSSFEPRISIRNKMAALLALVWIASGCGSLQNSVGISSAKKPASSDGQRPTDSSEGLPGYLTDPDSLVVLEKKDDASVVAVQGAQDAIRPGASPVEKLRVVIWSIPADTIEAIIGGEEMVDLANAATISRVEGDGSFRSEGFVRGPGETLLISILDQDTVARGGKIDLPFTFKTDRPSIATATANSFVGVIEPSYDETSLTTSKTVNSCINENSSFQAGMPIERLKPDPGLIGVTYDDSKQRSTPTIVVVEHISAASLAITMNLRDPNGLYCVKISTVTAVRVTIKHHKDATLDTHQVNVGLAAITSISEF